MPSFKQLYLYEILAIICAKYVEFGEDIMNSQRFSSKNILKQLNPQEDDIQVELELEEYLNHIIYNHRTYSNINESEKLTQIFYSLN